MDIADKIKSIPRLKKFVLWTLIPVNDNKPRLWVKWFLNPFKHKKGKGSRIRRSARIDVFPFNEFRLGDLSTIEDFTTINNGVGHVRVGSRTIIGMGSVVIGPVSIGNNVMLAQHIVISGLNHGYDLVDIPPSLQKVTLGEIEIEDDVWIGANSTIVSGVRIGKHAVIGAGSVVTKDIPPYSVAVGNPARVIKKYNESINAWEKV